MREASSLCHRMQQTIVALIPWAPRKTAAPAGAAQLILVTPKLLCDRQRDRRTVYRAAAASVHDDGVSPKRSLDSSGLLCVDGKPRRSAGCTRNNRRRGERAARTTRQSRTTQRDCIAEVTAHSRNGDGGLYFVSCAHAEAGRRRDGIINPSTGKRDALLRCSRIITTNGERGRTRATRVREKHHLDGATASWCNARTFHTAAVRDEEVAVSCD